MRTLGTTIAAAAFALATTACAAGAPQGPVSGPMATDAAVQTTVEVQSRNMSAVNVFLEASGIRYRLGTVRPMQTQQFVVPRSARLVSGAVQLVVDPVGSDHVYTTERFRVRPGQQIAFTVQNRLPVSSLMVLDR